MINQSRHFGNLPFGQTHVQYQAMDLTGNVRNCVITISVQCKLHQNFRLFLKNVAMQNAFNHTAFFYSFQIFTKV